MRIAREEIFGPVACVIRAKDYDEAWRSPTTPSSACARESCTTSLKHASHFKRTRRREW
jgi:aldehyde dehydrogenase (NAD+)